MRPWRTPTLGKSLKQVVRDLEVAIEQKKGPGGDRDLPVIEADPDQMRHLFQNLVGNSLKFSGDKEPLIRYPPGKRPNRRKKSGPAWYEIVDADNGIGFEEEYLEGFRSFRRLHGRSAIEGSGIGLAICKKVVERHNG